MKQRIEKYIPDAIKFISKVEIANSNGVVKNEFNGYFSAFGAAIIQSGLKPALAFFSNEKTAKDRGKILIAIYKLVVDASEKNVKPGRLLEYVIENAEKEAKLKSEIIDASIALKLAVRTYKLEKS